MNLSNGIRLYQLCLLWIPSLLFGAQIKLGKEVLTVEIADTPQRRAQGLMGRESLPDNTGMLFIYPREERLVFWMKNTSIALSIGFFDHNKTLLEMIDMDPPSQGPLIKYPSSFFAQYALEVPQGWFKKKKIQVGDKFSFLKTPNHLE